MRATSQVILCSVGLLLLSGAPATGDEKAKRKPLQEALEATDQVRITAPGFAQKKTKAPTLMIVLDVRKDGSLYIDTEASKIEMHRQGDSPCYKWVDPCPFEVKKEKPAGRLPGAAAPGYWTFSRPQKPASGDGLYFLLEGPKNAEIARPRSDNMDLKIAPERTKKDTTVWKIRPDAWHGKFDLNDVTQIQIQEKAPPTTGCWVKCDDVRKPKKQATK